MADSSMTSVKLFDKIVRDEHVDLLKEAVQAALQGIMAAEVMGLLGTGPHERTEGRRLTCAAGGLTFRAPREAAGLLPT